MKPRSLRIAALAALALAAAIAYQAGLAPKVTREARAQAYGPRLNFNQGIGFYAYSGGQLTWLKYPTTNRENIRAETMTVSKTDFHLYAYGLNYAATVFGLPPHMMDFAVVLRDTQINIDNPDFLKRDVDRRRGPYAVHFKPVAGYDQPVYEITCDLWESIKSKETYPITWGFKVKSGDNENAHGIFWFSFKGEAVEK
jgi:hypothetical protein